jgi:GNAT superfamily N-acetyltransferase
LPEASAIEIRRATAADAEAMAALNAVVQRLHAAAYPHIFKTPEAGAFPPSEVAALIGRPATTFLLACIGGVPVGYLYLEIGHRPESHWRYALDLINIHHIAVDAAHQGQGVASALFAAVRDLARAAGITHLELDVWAFNDHARAVFVRQGFTVYNRRMWATVDPEPG